MMDDEKERSPHEVGSSAHHTDKKLWPFFILEVLRKHAIDGAEQDDEGNRYLTRQQIVDLLENDYGIHTQIKAVGDNLTRLYEVGMDYPELGFKLEYLEGERNAVGASSSKGEKQLLRKGWRWAEESEFEPSEIRMLVDTVIASPVIPEKQAKTLIGKLLPLTTEEIAVPDIERVGHKAARNSEFFLNLELLNEAIQQRKRVLFFLGRFDQNGTLCKLSPRRSAGPYRVVPMQLLISKGHYYLLAHYSGNDKVYKFRVDLMLDVSIDGESREDASGSKVNIVKFREQHSYMMSGKVLKVTLRIDKRRLHTLYDQFGTHVHFKNEQEDTIDVELKAALYSVLFWALQYYRSVEVLSPPELREVLADAGRTIHEMYASAPGTIELGSRKSGDELIHGEEDQS